MDNAAAPHENRALSDQPALWASLLPVSKSINQPLELRQLVIKPRADTADLVAGVLSLQAPSSDDLFSQMMGMAG